LLRGPQREQTPRRLAPSTMSFSIFCASSDSCGTSSMPCATQRAAPATRQHSLHSQPAASLHESSSQCSRRRTNPVLAQELKPSDLDDGALSDEGALAEVAAELLGLPRVATIHGRYRRQRTHAHHVVAPRRTPDGAGNEAQHGSG
jgi:hypothetical protein